jgi:integration host factor subunit beta
MENYYLTRSKLASSLADKLKLDLHISEDLIKIIICGMKDTLSENNRIEVRRFGTFEVRKHLSRSARNPKTGEKLVITDRYIAHFKAGSILGKRLNCVKC